MEGDDIEKPIFRDVRRYYCDYCGICRSKKSLITSHVRAHHKEEMDDESVNGDGKSEGVKSNTCEECGASFKKPAYLKQHMQSHSLEELVLFDKKNSRCYCVKHWIPQKELQNAEAVNSYLNGPVSGGRLPEKLLQVRLNHAWFNLRPYTCLVADCHASYRRKDHLTRHLLVHQGKLFQCSIENCNKKFALQGNMTRHVRESHSESSPLADVGCQKQHVCQEPGCGKLFRFVSKLHKHEDSHVKFESVEAVCLEPGCMKYFSNVQCLKAHVQSCHQYIICDMCGTKQLKKNIKRHLRTHEGDVSSERIKCDFKGCLHTFSTKSNLAQHVKSVHLKIEPFACSFPDCCMRFSYKHVRDNHEKTALHVYTRGDFEDSDEQFRSRPRGGRKRKFPTVESLIRKRVAPPSHLNPIMNHFAL